MNYNSPVVKSKKGSEKESDGVNEDAKEKEDTIMELTAPFPMSRFYFFLFLIDLRYFK